MHETIGTGEQATESLVVTFTSREPLTNVTLVFGDQLRRFVAVEPSHFPSIQPNIPYGVRLHFSVPSETRPRTYRGTLHLKSRGAAHADHLKISLILDYGLNAVSPIAQGLNTDTQRHLLGISSDLSTLTFSLGAGQLTTLVPGDAVVLPPSALAPQGFLGEVTGRTPYETGSSG